MPIYEFACSDCGTKFEKRVSFSATAAPPCDNCESENVQRLLSAPAIHFKGSGWYITDSKKADKGAANGGANGSTNGETKAESGDTKAESSDKSSSSDTGSSSGESSSKSSESKSKVTTESA